MSQIRFSPERAPYGESMGSGTDGILYKSVWRNLNGRNVPYLWSNAGKRKLNLNWFENDWNANYRFAAVRNYLYFPALGGV